MPNFQYVLVLTIIAKASCNATIETANFEIIPNDDTNITAVDESDQQVDVTLMKRADSTTKESTTAATGSTTAGGPTKKPHAKGSPEETWDNSMAGVDSKDYCKFCCLNYDASPPSVNCSSTEHTMCKYTPNQFGSMCSNYINLKIESLLNIEKWDILHFMNQYRSKVATGAEPRGNPGPQPRAANMQQLSWDQELEDMAQTWAIQCMNHKDSCRDSKRFPVGQVVIETDNSFYLKSTMLQTLFQMVEGFDSKKVEKFDKRGDQSDDYSQVIWAESHKIGCGRVIFWVEEVKSREILVCNFGPTGNVPGESVYKEGEPCSMCPDETQCSRDYVGLCEDLNIELRITTAEIPEFEEKEEEEVRAAFGNKSVFVSYLWIMSVLVLIKFIY